MAVYIFILFLFVKLILAHFTNKSSVFKETKYWWYWTEYLVTILKHFCIHSGTSSLCHYFWDVHLIFILIRQLYSSISSLFFTAFPDEWEAVVVRAGGHSRCTCRVSRRRPSRRAWSHSCRPFCSCRSDSSPYCCTCPQLPCCACPVCRRPPCLRVPAAPCRPEWCFHVPPPTGWRTRAWRMSGQRFLRRPGWWRAAWWGKRPCVPEVFPS